MSMDVRIIGDTLASDRKWMAIPTYSPQRIVISQVDLSVVLRTFPILAGAETST